MLLIENHAVGNGVLLIENPAVGNGVLLIKIPAVGNGVLLIKNPAVGNGVLLIKNPAVGNRVYTNDVRLRGLRNMEFERNARWLMPQYGSLNTIYAPEIPLNPP